MPENNYILGAALMNTENNMKAIWENTVIAERDDTIQLEGNHYFPGNTVNKEFLSSSDTHTQCVWKGTASYYNENANGEENRDAAWYYPQPSDAAKNIRGYITFWRGVKVVE